MVRDLLSRLVLLCPAGCLEKLPYEHFIIHTEICKSKLNNQFNFDRIILQNEKLEKENSELKASNEHMNKKLQFIHSENENRLNDYKAIIQRLKDEVKRLKHNKADKKDGNTEESKTFEKNLGGFIGLDAVKVIIKECENYQSRYFPICNLCEKAFPCVECHDLNEDHECNFNDLLCFKCFEKNDINCLYCVNETCKNNLK
jgi:hypothetical protein